MSTYFFIYTIWASHGNLWATFWGISYLKAHPLGNRCPEGGSPTYTRTVDRIQSRALGDSADPKARMVPLYHGGLVNKPVMNKRMNE
ncbi:hypothetical protein E2C01_082716 [Portunus trituberculatus]|uniref:Uncharacterized protein n=1 Tax=Portunus trituberculatus TaxID=210409 RepID=A0A5B7J2H4_PORTR|nr:hypothetical protein [Portunus trituberculatus]